MSVCDPWTTSDELEACGFDTSTFDADLVTDVIAAASDWLNRATGERFGVCTTTERPCVPCGCDIPGFCSCGGESVIELTYGPVSGTPTVTEDGVAVTSFYVLPPNRLVRTDDDSWLTCQSLTSGEGLVVTYDHGTAVPELGRLAASDLAIELLKSCNGDTCSIPAGTTSINRRGVTIQLDQKQAGAALPRVAMLLSAYPRAKAGLTRLDRGHGLITAGPA